MKNDLRIKNLYLAALISCSLITGCATIDPVPPTVEFYEINSKDIPQGTFNIITERNKERKEEYLFFPSIKLKDSEGCVWLIEIPARDPKKWQVYLTKNNQIEKVGLVLSKEYKPTSYSQLNSIIYSDLMTSQEK